MKSKAKNRTIKIRSKIVAKPTLVFKDKKKDLSKNFCRNKNFRLNFR